MIHPPVEVLDRPGTEWMVCVRCWRTVVVMKPVASWSVTRWVCDPCRAATKGTGA